MSDTPETQLAKVLMEVNEKHSSAESKIAEFHDDSLFAPSANRVRQDRISIAVLLVLYALQGIPLGLCASIPLIMKERGVSYEGLSLFSLVTLPFSLKLLWAPLVDSCYFKSIGRRKVRSSTRLQAAS
jgi:PAT family acetyl-CoA transporter-like MFS transporter 1